MSTPPVEKPTRDRGAYSEAARQKLIESRLTPNAISLTGFFLCAIAAVLVWQDHLFWGGLAFVVGSVCDTLDGRYSRMSGKFRRVGVGRRLGRLGSSRACLVTADFASRR